MSGNFEVYENIAKLNHQDSSVRETAYLKLKKLEQMDVIDFNTLIDIKHETEELHILNYVIEALGMRKEERCYEVLNRMFQEQNHVLILQTLLYAFIRSESNYFIPTVLDKLTFKSGILKKKKYNEFLKTYNKILHLSIKYFQKAANEKTVDFLLPLLKSKNAMIKLNVLLVFDLQSLPLKEKLLKELVDDPDKKISLKAQFMLKNQHQSINID